MKPRWTRIAAIAEMTPPASGAVDLVLLDLDAADLEVATVNDQDERDRTGRFVFPRDARRFAVAHGFLRRLLAHRLACDPALLAFGQGPQGKPFLATPGLSDLAFNLSHAAGAGLIALGEVGALGVDIEAVRPLDDIAELAAQTFASGGGRLIAGPVPGSPAGELLLLLDSEGGRHQAVGRRPVRRSQGLRGLDGP